MTKATITTITTRQALFLTLPLLLIMGHFLLVPVYLQAAGKDAWIGIAAGFGAGAIIFGAMGKLQERLYGQTLIGGAVRWLGPVMGRIATLPVILYFLLLLTVTLYGTSIFVNSVFFPEHPLWIFSVTFALVMLYMVHKGIEVIARVSEWVLLYNIVSGMLVSLSLHHKKDFGKLLPMLEHGIAPVLPVMLLVLAVFGELIVMLMVQVRKEGAKSFSHSTVYWLIFASVCFILPSTSIGPVTIFGEEQAKELAFPVESTVRLISVGFIERFDIYGLTIMTVSALLRMALLQYAASVAVTEWLSLKDYRFMNGFVGASVVAGSLSAFEHYGKLLEFLRRYYSYGIVSCGLILMLWGITSFMGSRRKR